MNDQQRFVIAVNMSTFFNRELFMYSLGDIKFKKPISLKKVAYTMSFFIIWSLPIAFIFGIKMNPFFIAIWLIPPMVLGHYGSKPVWGGRGLLDYIKVMTNYIKEPRGWTDFKATRKLDKEVFYTASEIWVSRRREMYELAELETKEKQNNKVKQKV